MKEFIKSNQCLLYHVIIWSILIFIAMIEHRDYTFLIIMALFSLLNILLYWTLWKRNIPQWLNNSKSMVLINYTSDKLIQL